MTDIAKANHKCVETLDEWLKYVYIDTDDFLHVNAYK